MKRNNYLALSVMLLVVGWLIGASIGRYLALQPALEAESYARQIRAEIYARQIEAALDPPGTRFVLPFPPQQETE